MADIAASPFSSIETVVRHIKNGGMAIVTDDEDRENEGDLVASAARITPEMVNFMASHGKGLICAPLTEESATRLGLRSMVRVNREAHGTAFTVSVDAAQGITTGISAADRARTIRLLAEEGTRPDDLVQPGHVFPLLSRDGGVLRRAGHTEASIDLVTLAGLPPVAVICEILNDDGTMARLDDLIGFSQRHALPICTIEALIEHRRKSEKLVEPVGRQSLTTPHGEFTVHFYRSLLDDLIHLAVVKGDIHSEEPTLVRVQRADLLDDIFGPTDSLLQRSMKEIADRGNGVVVYMRQLENAMLQRASGSSPPRRIDPMDLKDYGTGAQILHDLGVRQIRLLTNTQRKVIGLDGHGLHIVEQLPLT